MKKQIGKLNKKGLLYTTFFCAFLLTTMNINAQDLYAIKNDFEEWARRGEFEKAVDFEERLREQSVARFYAFCHRSLHKNIYRFREYSNIVFGTYNTDEEYFPITLGAQTGKFYVSIADAQRMRNTAFDGAYHQAFYGGVQWRVVESWTDDWYFTDYGLLPKRIFITVGEYKDVEIALLLPNKQSIEIAFRDLGINNIYAKDAVFNDEIVEEWKKNGSYFATAFAFFESFLSESYSQKLPEQKKFAEKIRQMNVGCPGIQAIIRADGVRFMTDRVWKVGNQEWSDAVTAIACQKTTFHGDATSDNPSRFMVADCRNNSGYGDLFSRCAVVFFADILCPSPWRVPTKQDFMTLDVALGGTGDYRKSPAVAQQVSNWYINSWGGEYGGSCRGDGKLDGGASAAYYWTLDFDPRTGFGHLLNFGTAVDDGYINPQGIKHMGHGLTLRCVR